MAESRLSANQNYTKHVNGPLSVSHNMQYIIQVLARGVGVKLKLIRQDFMASC